MSTTVCSGGTTTLPRAIHPGFATGIGVSSVKSPTPTLGVFGTIRDGGNPVRLRKLTLAPPNEDGYMGGCTETPDFYELRLFTKSPAQTFRISLGYPFESSPLTEDIWYWTVEKWVGPQYWEYKMIEAVGILRGTRWLV